jgi:chromate transporter
MLTSTPTNNESLLRHPRSKTDLFLSFSWVALQGFGGVLAVIQREMVDRKRWFTQQQFLADWAVAQILPGPNVVNLALMLGDRYFGLRGAAAALAGILLAPLLIVVALAVLYAQYAQMPQVAGALRGMGAVAAGMLAAASFKMMLGLKGNVLGAVVSSALIAITFVAIAVLRWPLAWVVLGLGPLACGFAYWQILKTRGTTDAPKDSGNSDEGLGA